MWKDGGLSQEQFNHDLEDFVARSKALGDNWDVREAAENLQIVKRTPIRYLVKQTFQKIPGNGYTKTTCTGATGSSDQDLEDVNELQLTSEEDECELSLSTNNSYAKYEYHVIFSPSYGVPVLYFTANRRDGSLIGLNAIWSNIPQVYQERLQQEQWTFLTQQEHPILGTPFYQLHPCHTANMMKCIMQCWKQEGDTAESGIQFRNQNYLVTWLSSVGPVVGLDLSLGYSSTVQNPDQHK